MTSRKKTDSTGCPECTKRRIKCDLKKPICFKCEKAGLSCSSAGRFRFNVGAAKRGKLKGLSGSTIVVSLPTQPKPEIPLKWPSLSYPAEPDELSRPSDGSQTSEASIAVPARASTTNQEPQLKAWIEPLSSAKRASFAYWSSFVAPFLTLFPDLDNGFVHYLLPLGYDTELIGDAIDVTANQAKLQRHGIGNVYELEANRSAIISRLSKLDVNPQNSTAQTLVSVLLVLLVGENVAGTGQSESLLKIIYALFNEHGSRFSNNIKYRMFLDKQVFGFQVCSSPFIQQEAFDAIPIERHLEDCVSDFGELYHTQLTRWIRYQQICEAVTYARNFYGLCLQDATVSACAELEKLKMIIQDIPSASEAEHKLVWAYFMAAVFCSDEQDRDIFLARLKSIYERSRFRNVRIGIEYLERAWSTQMSAIDKYTELTQLPTLIMI